MTNYFKDLFAKHDHLIPYNLTGQFPMLNPQTLDDLNKDISDEEIRKTVRSIGAYKAPGPDGYQAIFYHSQ